MDIEEGQPSHVDESLGFNKERILAEMKDKISTSVKSASGSEPDAPGKRCIFRFPKNLKDIFNNSHNLKNIFSNSQEPQVVAIGPYHRGRFRCRLMEEIKWRCLHYFLDENHSNLEQCFEIIHPLEKKSRECYSGTINLDTPEFFEMMVLDGCFILFFLRSGKYGKIFPKGHPFRGLEREILPKVCRDLFLLENQIPFFVVKSLCQISKGTTIAESLFDIVVHLLMEIMAVAPLLPHFMPTDLSPRREWLHLLDIARSIYIPEDHKKKRGSIDGSFNLFPCVTKLLRVGIKVNQHRADSFLEVKFKGSVIEMPVIILDGTMSSFLVNCVAFEQCHHRTSKHFSTYAIFLDCLVNTARDIDYLCDRRVFDNYIGTEAQAAEFINNLGKSATDIDYDDFYLSGLFLDVNKYYRKRLSGFNWQWTSFKREYFGKPWLLISAFVAFVLLVLTFLQTYYTIYAYVHPKK